MNNTKFYSWAAGLSAGCVWCIVLTIKNNWKGILANWSKIPTFGKFAMISGVLAIALMATYYHLKMWRAE